MATSTHAANIHIFKCLSIYSNRAVISMCILYGMIMIYCIILKSYYKSFIKFHNSHPRKLFYLKLQPLNLHYHNIMSVLREYHDVVGQNFILTSCLCYIRKLLSSFTYVSTLTQVHYPLSRILSSLFCTYVQ